VRHGALLLAAGRVERLRPLTLALPKPLLPVAGRPLAAWSLDRMAAAGCDAVALNLHHLGESIRGAFGDRFERRVGRAVTTLPLHYSDESAELLGTGGALPPLADFFRGATLALIVNGDSLCRWPLRELVAHHRRMSRQVGALATLLVQRTVDPHAFGGGVAVEGGRIVAFRKGALAWESARTKRVFAGAAVIDPALVARLPNGPSDIVGALYEPMLAAGEPIATLETGRPWFDLGTPERYLEAALAWALRGLPSGGAWIDPGATVESSAKLRRAAVERDAAVGAGTRLTRTVVLPGATVGAGARLERVIVGPGVALVPGSAFERCLLTRGSEPTAEPISTPF
jgi:mannose-1-phosphate guanylyltransferase